MITGKSLLMSAALSGLTDRLNAGQCHGVNACEDKGWVKLPPKVCEQI